MRTILKNIYLSARKAVPQPLRRFIGYSVWARVAKDLLYRGFRRIAVIDGGYAVRRYRRNAFRNSIGITAVFIAKENILFLKEWILYHKLKGVDYFFLYDNSGVEKWEEWNFADIERDVRYGYKPRSTNKYGVRYDALVKLSSAKIDAVMDDIQRTIPGVHFVKWQPRSEDGKIGYEQLRAFHDAENRFGHLCDWIFSIDVDEFLVSDSALKDITRHLFVQGYAGGYVQQKKMAGRFQNLDRYCVEIERECEPSAYSRYAYKYLYRTKKGATLGVHGFGTSDAKYFFPWGKLIYHHYNDDPWNKNRTRKITTPVIDPELIAELKARAGDYCSPEWRTGSANLTADIWVKDKHMPP